MAKFSEGDSVVFKSGARRMYGRVVGREGTQYRLFTVDRRQITCDARQLSNSRRVVLILESNLSSGREALRSDKQRRAGVFLEELLRSFPAVTVLREKIHTIRDLKYFMKLARQGDVQYIHYCGHGAHFGGENSKQAGLVLTAEHLYLPFRKEEYIRTRLKRNTLTAKERRDLNHDVEQYKHLIEVFGSSGDALKGRILILSACELGKRNGFAQHVSRISGAKAVIAYDDEVYDAQTNVAEALLYWQLLFMETKKSTPGKFVQYLRETAQKLMRYELPIVCYVDGEKVA